MIIDLSDNLLPHQQEFFDSESPSTGLITGFGGGKSYIGTWKCIRRLMELRTNVGYYLPTYQLIKDIAFQNFYNAFEQLPFKFHLHETDKKFITPYGSIIMRSMDNPTNIVGYEVGYSLIDEGDVLPTDHMNKAYRAIVARNRSKLPDGKTLSIDVVSTPEGFKFAYNHYVKNGNERRRLIQANTLDNPYLSADYIANLYDTYTADQLEAYMRGQFVNLTSGTVYRSFDRKKNIDNSKEAGSNILYIGMDFNITNMAATISIKEKDIRYVVDEVVDAYDTAEMINILNRRYPDNRKVIYPDAAGRARNTAGKSDHDLLKKAGFKVIAPSKNPSVRDRVNAVNKEFENQTTFINENKCPSLVDALEKQAYNKNGEPDKQSGMDHINDSLGYELVNSKTGIKVRGSSVF